MSYPLEDNLVISQNNELKTNILIVDSRNRDKIKYPNPNQYQYELNEPYKRVVNAELLYAYIPKTSYLIDSTNDILSISYNEDKYNIHIPHGNYTQDKDSDNDPYSLNLDYQINNILDSRN